uniref:Uncharacterized protein n=1 Tax=Anguilla anguilla TaxID=7936 RepID=A0A0E9S4P8_ANGAN
MFLKPLVYDERVTLSIAALFYYWYFCRFLFFSFSYEETREQK